MTGLQVWLHPSSRTVKLSFVVGRWSLVVSQLPTLTPSSLRRTASVVRDRRHVANGSHFNAGGRERPHRGLAAGSRATDTNIHAAHTVIARQAGRIRRRLLRRERHAFTQSAQPPPSQTSPH